jgi:hypothetical protein
VSRHQALQDRLSAIEAQLAVPPVRQALPRRPAALRHDAADRVSPVLQQLLAEVLPGALVLDWRQDGAIHAGRMVADGLVYRFRVDAAGVGYRPAWEGVLQKGWEIRSDSFLQLRAPAARMDFRRTRAGGGQKRKCSTGYGCGNACISLQKECRIAPRSAIGKGRLRRLQQLAAAGDQSAGKTASQVQASRGEAAAALQKDRISQRVQKLLERPEIAEFLRTGKLPSGANNSTEPGTVREMKPGEIAFDPARFQYKLNATATTGEVGSLSGVRKWDANLSGVMSVWKDPSNGKTYVINGHNRLALAGRLGAEAVTVRFLNAANATEARAIGALQNIAEGAGSPMDAAKFFRDTGIKSQQDVEARGLPLGSGQASKGLSLSKLPGDVFNAVVRGDLTVNRGAIIGGSGLDDAKQREVFKMVGARKAITDQTLQELVEHAAASVQRTQTTMSLFGETEEAKDNLITRAKLSAGLKAKIAREKRLFATVSKAKAATSLTEKGGNTINQEQSAKVAGEASEALGVFERLKSSAGPISSALNRAADRVEAGEAEATVRKELERDVFQAVQAELEAVGLRKRPRADSLQERIDALKRKCTTGYGCGSACISLRKECRSQPQSAMGKERMRKLLALAAGETSPQRGVAPVRSEEASRIAAGINARRGEKAQQLREQRQQAQVKAAVEIEKARKALRAKPATTTEEAPGDRPPPPPGGSASNPEQAYLASTVELGRGMYGSVRLASDGLVVKRGVITQVEQRALQRLDGTGLTPGIKAVVLTAGPTAYGKGKNGFVVMDRAKGDVLTKWINDGGHGTEESREVFSAMLRARKELHSRGIAHNDMHAGNVFWDGKRMMVIDFGMARINPTAALIEGLGTARGKAFLGKVEEPGDYQSRSTIQALNRGNVQSGNPDWKRFKTNRKRVEAALKAEGGAAIIERSIRSVPKDSPITPARAAELVRMLYEGL